MVRRGSGREWGGPAGGRLCRGAARETRDGGRGRAGGPDVSTIRDRSSGAPRASATRAGKIGVVAMAAAAIAYWIAPAAAQVGERAEVLIGAGALTTGQHNIAGVYYLGGGTWFDDRWGIAAHYTQTAGDGFAFVRVSGSGNLALIGSESYRYWTWTGRHRVFLNNGTELVMGLGAQVVGVRRDRVVDRRLDLSVGSAEWLPEEERSLLGPTDETRRKAWHGPLLAWELRIGRKFGGHVGIAGGVVFLRGWRRTVVTQPVVSAMVWF